MSQESRDEINSTTVQPKTALKKAIARHKELLKNSQSLREEYLQSLIDNMDERDEKSKTSLKSLLYR
jgi:hypothetical protein